MRMFPSASRALGDSLGLERFPRRPDWLGERELRLDRYDRLSGDYEDALELAAMDGGLDDEIAGTFPASDPFVPDREDGDDAPGIREPRAGASSGRPSAPVDVTLDDGTVIVLDAGRIVAQGTPHEVMAAPMQETVAQLGEPDLRVHGVVAGFQTDCVRLGAARARDRRRHRGHWRTLP